MITPDYFDAVFPLVKNAELWVKTREKVRGPHGGDIYTWEGDDRTEAYREPYSSALASKEYGLDVECQDRIFCPPTAALVEGVGVYYTDRDGDPDAIVVSATPWPGHVECLLQRR